MLIAHACRPAAGVGRGRINGVNELEWVDGELWGNVFPMYQVWPRAELRVEPRAVPSIARAASRADASSHHPSPVAA